MKSGLLKNLRIGALLLATACVLSGCLAGGGSLTNIPNDEVASVSLKIRLGKLGVETNSQPGILTKSSTIFVKKMIVRFTSNLNDTLRDTLSSNTWSGIGTDQLLDQSVDVHVKLRALRWWNIDIETRDQNDSVIHKGSAGPIASRGGQSVELTIPLLDSRYVMYEAQYRLPKQIWSSNVVEEERVYQKIYFHRLVLEMDSVPMRDSTSFDPAHTAPGTRFILAEAGRLRGADGKLFFRPFVGGSDTATHIQTFDYVPVGKHSFTISAYGYLEGDSVGGINARKLFTGTTNVNIVQGQLPPPDTLNMVFVGNKPDPENPNPAPIETEFSFQIILGRTQTGSMTLIVDPSVPF
jgi:hypothetical protein